MTRKLPPPLLILLFLGSLPVLHCQCTFPESTSFSLELVRRKIRTTPPFHNLDSPEKIVPTTQKYSNLNKINTSKKSIDDFPNYTIRPPLTRYHYLYTIDAKLGTPSKQRTFIFDTGSDLTWTKCTPFNNSSNLTGPLFDPKKSSSYQKLPPNHSLARFFDCSNGNECKYNVTYMSGQSTSGIASIETFTFPSNKWFPENIKGVVFGCSNNFIDRFTSPISITGIMGMNRSPHSFIGQLGTRTVRRFSYCLPKLDSPVKSTYLRFGNDIKESSHFQRTGFVNPRNDYFVSLLNITLAGRHLVVPNGVFPSLCGIDIGSARSAIKMEAYNEVVKALSSYFIRYNLTRLTGGPGSRGELCYRLHQGFRNYPNMFLHFEGAILEIVPEKLFRFLNDRFCLALSGSQGISLLGAYQMQNVRFVFDVSNDKLLFGYEDCSKDNA